jgi:uncharacterized protein (DUF2267 family)
MLTDDLEISRKDTWHALGVVLRVLRDRVPVDHAAMLGAELPMLVRGHYYDQYRPAEMPEKWRSFDEFLERVASGIDDIQPIDPSRAARAVLRLLSSELDAGLITKIRDAMPQGVRDLWAEAQAERQTADA